MSSTSVDLAVGRGPPSEADTAADLKKHENGRDRLRRLLHSQQFHLIICILIILDIILIIIELLAEMRFLEANLVEIPEHTESPLAHWAHKLSITVLFIFLVENIVKIYAFGIKGFLEHKLEVFDAVIVVISLIFDLMFYRPDSAASIGSGLIITLRLWRVGRLLNGELSGIIIAKLSELMEYGVSLLGRRPSRPWILSTFEGIFLWTWRQKFLIFPPSCKFTDSFFGEFRIGLDEDGKRTISPTV